MWKRTVETEIEIEKIKEIIFKSMIEDGMDPEFVYSIAYKSVTEIEPGLRRHYELKNGLREMMPPLRFEFIGRRKNEAREQ